MNIRVRKKAHKVFMIAEAGVNHNGSLSLAKKMVDFAKTAGADAVKFQAFKAELLASRFAEKAAYQRCSGKDNESQCSMLRRLELSQQELASIFDYCKKKQILFLATPFDSENAKFLNRIGMRMFKISSTDITNLPFLKLIGSFKKPVILSTGMSNLEEVREAIKALASSGNRRITLLHCTSNYPARYADAHLCAMHTLGKEFKLDFGYSDHTQGIEVALAAVGMGASVIEKHFTLNKRFSGPDHRASAGPQELKNLIGAVRNIEIAFGSTRKKPCPSEKAIMKIARKSIVAACDISQGACITSEMLTVKRPGTGIKPKHLFKVVGRTARRSLCADEVITWRDIK